MLKPKGLSQDALIRLSCGGALEHFQLRRPAFPFSFSFSFSGRNNRRGHMLIKSHKSENLDKSGIQALESMQMNHDTSKASKLNQLLIDLHQSGWAN